MLAVSIIIPAYMRVNQTLHAIQLLLNSKGIGQEFSLEIIVSDSSTDNSLKTVIHNTYNNTVIYTRPDVPGIASNKNKGASIATSPILIFCDTDIEIKLDTIQNTLSSFRKHPTAAAIGGNVQWLGGPKNGTLDRPRAEDRSIIIGETTYVEALYSRYFATYKEVFHKVGGYDETVFNMRGEGSDLSVRYWRHGYPLTYDPTIKVKHVYESEGGIIRGVSYPEWGIARDFLLLMLKYDMTEDTYENLSHTVFANFSMLEKESYMRLLQGIAKNIDHVSKHLSYLHSYTETEKSLYDFKFLEVFSDRERLEQCINTTPSRLNPIRQNLFI